MPKILVADDNSNIQKMVVLALKDQGIDVVAVGNGEAAVRKISDVRPDLVLADVFMPVRNGYEVCQYVKTDSALSHIPVILLVGAFDPLDEQEAQRVGADGVLKKPFVPPDPLISMVKSALARAGVAHAADAALKNPEPEALRGTDLLIPSVPKAGGYGNVPVPAAPPEVPAAALETESFVDEIPAHPEPVTIDAGTQPVAFGSLLETPASDTDDELAYMPPPELASDRDWNEKDEDDVAEEEEEEAPAPWRRDEAVDTHAGHGSKSASQDWRSGSFEQIKARRTQIEDWAPAEEKPEVVKAAETPQEVKSVAKETPAASAVIPETKSVLPPVPSAADAWAAVIATGSKEQTAQHEAPAFEEAAPASSYDQSAPEELVINSPEPAKAEPEKKAAESSWFSTSSSPWDAQLQKANQLASTWDTTVITPIPGTAKNGSESMAARELAKTVIEEAALPPSTVEAIREEAAQLAEDVANSAAQLAASSASAETKKEAAPAAEPSMDDLVAKVLAKMNPEMLQAVTREILKPVVEAMVKEELKSKKT